MIRQLHPDTDLPAIVAFYTDAADYWLMAEGQLDAAQKAADFFTDTPPGCNAADSHRLGFFEGNILVGLAELSFGFPDPKDAYLGLMILAPRCRNRGLGQTFLAHIEAVARDAAAPNLYLAVLEKNVRGAAFWARMAFRPTGHSGTSTTDHLTHSLHRLVKPLNR